MSATMKRNNYAAFRPILAAMTAIALTILLAASFMESTQSIQLLGRV